MNARKSGSSEIVDTVGQFVALYPPGGTPRLYGRQDARRYGTVARVPMLNRTAIVPAAKRKARTAFAVRT